MEELNQNQKNPTTNNNSLEIIENNTNIPINEEGIDLSTNKQEKLLSELENALEEVKDDKIEENNIQPIIKEY